MCGDSDIAQFSIMPNKFLVNLTHSTLVSVPFDPIHLCS
uniref:Uncharacterized protein n=1 Tax=Arundo donax TaxID=35708 RepID=A0A0A8Y216_ARUDO